VIVRTTLACRTMQPFQAWNPAIQLSKKQNEKRKKKKETKLHG
jgi:hypothetical protein